MSLKLIDATFISKRQYLIDVGDGASVLVDCLLNAGFNRLAVLDISAQSLQRAKTRLGEKANEIEWYEADVTEFQPPHPYELWHDRAVFHLLGTFQSWNISIKPLASSLPPGVQPRLGTSKKIIYPAKNLRCLLNLGGLTNNGYIIFCEGPYAPMRRVWVGFILRTGKQDLSQLRSWQDWFLKFELQTVPGVAEVATVGGMVKQYQVIVDQERLRAFNIPLSRISHAIKNANQEVGGSVIELAEAEYMIRTRGYLSSIEDIET